MKNEFKLMYTAKYIKARNNNLKLFVLTKLKKVDDVWIDLKKRVYRDNEVHRITNFTRTYSIEEYRRYLAILQRETPNDNKRY